MPASPRILLYSHNTRGFGHAARSINLAWGIYTALPESSILYCSGGSYDVYSLLPPNADLVKLPTLKAIEIDDEVVIRPARLTIKLSAMRALRRDILNAAARAFDPDVLLADYVPMGKRCELEPAVKHIRAQPNRLLALGLRDVVNDEERAEAFLKEQVYTAVQQYYDVVFIYGDPRLFDTGSAYHFPPAVKACSLNVGYVTPGHRPYPPANTLRQELSCEPDTRLIVANFGGGMDTLPLAEIICDAWEMVRGLCKARLLMIGGPYANWPLDFRTHEDMVVMRNVPWLSDYLAVADLFIGTSSYNLSAEILMTGTPAIFIPRHQLDSDEQLIRARLLSQYAHIAMIEQADRAQIARLMLVMLDQKPARPGVNVDGALRVGQYIQEWLARR